MHRRVTRVILVCLALALAFATLTALRAAPGVEAASPALRLNPTRGTTGTRVSVSGTSFPSNTTVSLAWDNVASGMPTARTNAAGAFQATFVVPANARSGRHTVKATAGRRSASATFTVSPVPLPTATGTPPAVSHWRPALNTSWQIQYTGAIDTSLNVAMYNLDGFDTSAATVAALHSAGKRVVCYISAGSWEAWRPDAGQFPAAVKGNELDGWPGERWLDIRRIDILGPIMAARMDMCRAKGFDAVDPDNVNGYTNSTGFPLSASDQLRYNRWLADAAHARGLAIGLKNDGDQATQLLDWFDFATVEQCYQFNECAVWNAFVAAGKPVFVIEYSGATTTFCPQANAANFNAIKKRLELDAWRQACR